MMYSDFRKRVIPSHVAELISRLLLPLLVRMDHHQLQLNIALVTRTCLNIGYNLLSEDQGYIRAKTLRTALLKDTGIGLADSGALKHYVVMIRSNPSTAMYSIDNGLECELLHDLGLDELRKAMRDVLGVIAHALDFSEIENLTDGTDLGIWLSSQLMLYYTSLDLGLTFDPTPVEYVSNATEDPSDVTELSPTGPSVSESEESLSLESSKKVLYGKMLAGRDELHELLGNKPVLSRMNTSTRTTLTKLEALLTDYALLHSDLYEEI